MTLGERLKNARIRADLKQVDVSEITKINNKTLSNWEKDVSKPDADSIAILADLYKVSSDYLLGRQIIDPLCGAGKIAIPKKTRLAELRKARKMSQAKLGEILEVSQNTISQWENGTRDPDTETLKKIADFFEVSTDYILKRNPFLLEIELPSNLSKNTPQQEPVPGCILRRKIRNMAEDMINSDISSTKKAFIQQISDSGIDDETVEELQQYLEYLISKKAKKDTSTTA